MSGLEIVKIDKVKLKTNLSFRLQTSFRRKI